MSKTTPRIGLLTPAWPGHNTANGITTSVYHLAIGLRDIGHPPVVISSSVDGEAPDGIPLIQTGKDHWSLLDRVRAKLSSRSGEKISRQKWTGLIVDAVHAACEQHGVDIFIMEETLGWAREVVPQVDVPVVTCLHGPWLLHKGLQSWGAKERDLGRERIEEQAFQASAGLLSPSQNVLEALEKAYDFKDKPRRVILNSYRAPKPTPPPMDGPILFIGRYDRHKGGDTVLAAFEDLNQTHPDAKLSFVGPDRGFRHSDGSVTKLETDIKATTPAVQTQFLRLGMQNSAEVASLRETHPIALIASRYENMNYTLLEAMAAGQAIVSTNVGGPAEILEDGKTALLVPPEDPAAMANALRRLLDDRTLIRQMGQAARATIENRFDPETLASETIAFCQDVIAHQTQHETAV